MALLRSLIMKLEWFARKYLLEYNQSNLCVLDHFGTFMTCSATFLLEVSEPVSLKVTTEDYFRGETLHLRHYSSRSKKEECDQRDLQISDQLETLILCSTKYFLGTRARLLQKLATGNSSM